MTRLDAWSKTRGSMAACTRLDWSMSVEHADDLCEARNGSPDAVPPGYAAA